MIKVISKANAPFLSYDLKIEEKEDDLILREFLEWAKDRPEFCEAEKNWIANLLERINHRSMMANVKKR